ncbi:MAG: ParM/StbA family protein [Chloroflexota bacterium]|nr:ParM/StbA family protein [Chloroflexota bacterium]
MKTTQIISNVGLGTIEMGGLTLGRYSQGKSATTPHVVEYGDAQYLVGPNIADYGTSINQLDHSRFLIGGPAERSKLYATLGSLLGQGEYTLSLMVGLPVSVMIEKSQEARTALKGWMEDTHIFKLDGQDTTVHIKRIHTTMQPLGTFFAWGLNDDGVWVQKDYNPQANNFAEIAIGDIGFNTADTLVVRDGKPVRGKTAGADIGMYTVSKLVQQMLWERHKAKFDLHTLDHLMRNGHNSIRIATGEIDTKTLFEEAKQSTAGRLLSFFSREANWENGNQFAKILFTGGGSQSLGDYLLKGFPNAEIFSVMDNAIGLARFARIFFGDADTVASYDAGYGLCKAAFLG